MSLVHVLCETCLSYWLEILDNGPLRTRARSLQLPAFALIIRVCCMDRVLTEAKFVCSYSFVASPPCVRSSRGHHAPQPTSIFTTSSSLVHLVDFVGNKHKEGEDMLQDHPSRRGDEVKPPERCSHGSAGRKNLQCNYYVLHKFKFLPNFQLCGDSGERRSALHKYKFGQKRRIQNEGFGARLVQADSRI
jgi:hypothetical protein